MADEAAPQKTFDWTQESAECVEGIVVDPDTLYDFQLDEINPTIILTKKGEERKIVKLLWLQPEMKIKFKMDLWVNERERVNPTNPDLESDNVALSRKLGYNPVLGGKFSLSDFLKLGMAMQAKLAPREYTRDGQVRTIHEIVVDTIQSDGSSSQATIPEKVSDAVSKEILALAKGCKKQSDLMSKINKAKKFDLLQPAMLMIEQGQIKFS